MPPSGSLSLSWLALVLPIVVAVTIFARPHWLVVLALLAVVIPQRDWIIAGTRIDARDLVLLGILASYLLRPRRLNFKRVPYIKLWALLGVLMSISYVLAPINSPNLTDPLRITYQVIRYCWKPILLYPLAYVLIGTDPKARASAITGIIVAGVIVSIHASIEGYALEDPRAFFSGGNSMGGALIMPLVLALAGSLNWAASRRRVLLSILATAIIGRGLVFANSRGAFVAAMAGVMAFLGLMLLWSTGRKYFVRAVGLALAATVTLFAVKPDLLDRPNVRHVLTAFRGTADANFQWRSQQRWPVFIEKIKEHPYFGVGTNRDVGLSAAANTPHNGYISLAVTYGVPVAFLYALLVSLGAVNGIRVARGARPREERLYAVAISGGLIGILVHNIVESTLMVTFVYEASWVLTATTTAAILGGVPALPATAAQARRRVRALRRRPLRPALRQEPSA